MSFNWPLTRTTIDIYVWLAKQQCQWNSIEIYGRDQFCAGIRNKTERDDKISKFNEQKTMPTDNWKNFEKEKRSKNKECFLRNRRCSLLQTTHTRIQCVIKKRLLYKKKISKNGFETLRLSDDLCVLFLCLTQQFIFESLDSSSSKALSHKILLIFDTNQRHEKIVICDQNKRETLWIRFKLAWNW